MIVKNDINFEILHNSFSFCYLYVSIFFYEKYD